VAAVVLVALTVSDAFPDLRDAGDVFVLIGVLYAGQPDQCIMAVVAGDAARIGNAGQVAIAIVAVAQFTPVGAAPKGVHSVVLQGVP